VEVVLGTFKITYLHHSGFICELEDCILVFDYYMDPEGKLDDLCEVSSKPLYFFKFSLAKTSFLCYNNPTTFIK